MQELEPDGADEALTAIAEAALPARGETVEAWSEREVMRLAVIGRLAGDISGAIAAHRLLADMHGSLRGGYRERRSSDQDILDMTPEEQENTILEAADEIKARRKEAKAARANSRGNGNVVKRASRGSARCWQS
jgi:hypothetical protein